METAAAFVEWLRGLPPAGIYAVLFVVAWGENVVPPIPGDLVVVVAGSFVALGLLGLVPTFVIASVGSVLGFLTVYGAGRRLGAAVHDPERLRWIPRGAITTVTAWLERWGMGVIAANRFLSGGRAVIGLLAGASRLPAGPVAAWATVSALAWNVVLVGGGVALGSQWERLVVILGQYGRVVTLLLVAAALVWGVRWRRSRKRAEDGRRETEDSGS